MKGRATGLPLLCLSKLHTPSIFPCPRSQWTRRSSDADLHSLPCLCCFSSLGAPRSRTRLILRQTRRQTNQALKLHFVTLDPARCVPYTPSDATPTRTKTSSRWNRPAHRRRARALVDDRRSPRRHRRRLTICRTVSPQMRSAHPAGCERRPGGYLGDGRRS